MALRTIVFSLSLCLVLKSVASSHWAHHIVLDNGIYNLYWNPPGKGVSEITFRSEVKATGCIALGFSRDGRVPGSDLVIGWIKDGTSNFQDRHADENGQLIKDAQQDYELIESQENDTHTIFEFRRKLDTCDENDMKIDESTLSITYSYSAQDLPDDFDESFSPKEEFRSKSILLLSSNIMGNLDLNSPSLSQWDIVAPEVNLSATDDLIWCKIVKTPNITEKNHIVLVRPLIQEEHKEFVFHIAMYECIGGTPEEFEPFLDYRGHECYHPDIPNEMLRCQGIILGWIMGGGDILYPENAGVPIYPGTYFLYEVNYRNPELKPGIIDTSGIRYYYTSELRENDAGLYALGMSISHRSFIPPGQDEYVVAGHSSPGCVNFKFPPSGAMVFGLLLHSRFMGRRMNLRHFRNNTELKPFAYNNNFDPSYQEYTFYEDERTILPNDQLTRECVMDSSERSDVTFSEMSTKSVICVGLLLFYPFDGEYISHSGSSLANINRVLNTSIEKDADIASVLKDYDWKSANIKEVQDELRYAEQEVQCYFGPFREGEEPPLVSYPKDFIPYEPEPTCSGTGI